MSLFNNVFHTSKKLKFLEDEISFLNDYMSELEKGETYSGKNEAYREKVKYLILRSMKMVYCGDCISDAELKHHKSILSGLRDTYKRWFFEEKKK